MRNIELILLKQLIIKSRYRTPGPLEEDINTMHRYRDALVVEQEGPFERTAYGAYVLFPWNQEEAYENHPFYKKY